MHLLITGMFKTMPLGWLVTTLGLLWEGRGRAGGILVPYFTPLQGQPEHACS